MAELKKVPLRTTAKIKILIADSDRPLVRRISEFLVENGFETRHSYQGSDVRTSMVNWKPDLVLMDLMLPNGNALEILHYKQNEPALQKLDSKVIVMSSHSNPENMARSFERGANDYIKKPFLYPDLLNRIVIHCRQKATVASTVQAADVPAHWIMTELLLDQALEQKPVEQVLFHLAQMVASKMDAVRCSFVRSVTHTQGGVIASSDDHNVSGLSLDLGKYPEIQLVVNTGKMIAIENLDASRALKKIKTELKSIHFNSMIVCPVFYRGKVFGVISVRLPAERKKLSDEEIRFVAVVAKIASLTLNAHDVSHMTKFGLISAS